MFAFFIRKKRVIQSATQEQVLALSDITNILASPQIPQPLPEKFREARKPLLAVIEEDIMEIEEVDSIQEAEILDLTRAERPITYDVAVFIRGITEEESARAEMDFGIEIEEEFEEEDISAEDFFEEE